MIKRKDLLDRKFKSFEEEESFIIEAREWLQYQINKIIAREEDIYWQRTRPGFKYKGIS